MFVNRMFNRIIAESMFEFLKNQSPQRVQLF